MRYKAQLSMLLLHVLLSVPSSAHLLHKAHKVMVGEAAVKHKLTQSAGPVCQRQRWICIDDLDQRAQR